MKKIILYAVLFSVVSCKTSSPRLTLTSYTYPFNEYSLSFYYSKRKQDSALFQVLAYQKNQRLLTQYDFYKNSNTVLKRIIKTGAFFNRDSAKYLLQYGNNYQGSFAGLDSQVIYKVIRLGDSLKTKDMSYLLQNNGFVLLDTQNTKLLLPANFLRK